jgi:hypothetical protein
MPFKPQRAHVSGWTEEFTVTGAGIACQLVIDHHRSDLEEHGVSRSASIAAVLSRGTWIIFAAGSINLS